MTSQAPLCRTVLVTRHPPRARRGREDLIKPKTLADYRHLIERYVKPHIGNLRLQGGRPARITKLYRDLVASGGRDGRSLSPRTVAYVHAVLRKAFGDAVRVDQLLASNAVFTTAWGEPIHPDTASSLMASLIARHNKAAPARALPPARLHDLRHIHATTLLLAGVPVHVVAARLGHADPSITLRVYAHVINEQLVEAADIFAKQIKAA